MRFRWDWLSPVVTAPYIPALGPVHPDVVSADLFDAVADVASTGRFLPYDKDRRWADRKDEHVLVQEIIHRPGRTVIPTLSTRGQATLKIHYYGGHLPDPAEVAEWAHKWNSTYGTRRGGRLIWLQETPDGARTRLMLKTFTSRDEDPTQPVLTLDECEDADTFAAFAEQLGVDGFAFLHRRREAGLDDGPILVAVEDHRIVGAIGPLSTMLDALGTRQQPPQYFAVHPDYRHRGHGRALWRAAMAWGRRNGADYKVLQAAVGSAAESLYVAEGMDTLGYVCMKYHVTDG
ncbi:GNAT family N-acetyltransferase [Spirillospora sp. CA-255316]